MQICQICLSSLPSPNTSSQFSPTFTLKCGHEFCRPCLVSHCNKSKKATPECPICTKEIAGKALEFLSHLSLPNKSEEISQEAFLEENHCK